MPNSNAIHTDKLMGQDLYTIKGVEVFATGTWNGKKIEDQDLDSIVEAYGETEGILKPHLKLGHNDEQGILKSAGLPAAGWVENVRRVGSKLVADFVDIPKEIYQLIQKKAYRKVSCEIYNDIQIDTKKYRKFLGAVALLGSEMPAVRSLKDILSQYSDVFSRFKTVETFTTENSEHIIRSIEINLPSENFGMEQQLQEAQAKNDKLQADLAAAQAKMDAFSAQVDEMKKAKEETERKLVEAQRATQEAEADKFVSELQAEKLCSKAMAPLVKAAVSNVEKYSADGKDYSRQDLVKEILKGAAEAAKVNFSNATTTDAKAGEETEAEKAKRVEKYAEENKISYSEAYRQLSKSK
jgi:bacterioferritin (cytochrome b1)